MLQVPCHCSLLNQIISPRQRIRSIRWYDKVLTRSSVRTNMAQPRRESHS